MPRWFFLVLVTCLALSVVGGVLIVLRSPKDAPGPAGAPSTGGTLNAPPAPVPQTGGGAR